MKPWNRINFIIIGKITVLFSIYIFSRISLSVEYSFEYSGLYFNSVMLFLIISARFNNYVVINRNKWKLNSLLGGSCWNMRPILKVSPNVRVQNVVYRFITLKEVLFPCRLAAQKLKCFYVSSLIRIYLYFEIDAGYQNSNHTDVIWTSFVSFPISIPLKKLNAVSQNI